MFGQYFGAHYFGDPYFGPAAGAVQTTYTCDFDITEAADTCSFRARVGIQRGQLVGAGLDRSIVAHFDIRESADQPELWFIFAGAAAHLSIVEGADGWVLIGETITAAELAIGEPVDAAEFCTVAEPWNRHDEMILFLP